MIFCKECGCRLKVNEAYLCPSCLGYFCHKHRTEHNCKIISSEDEDVDERDWIQIEGKPGIFKVLSKRGRELIVESLSDGKMDRVITPPTKVWKILKPLERLMMGVFDPPEKFDIYVDALRLRYAYLYNPATVLPISKIDPLPHQIEAVYKRMLSVPEPRFLLADDVGLGKTITAGMVLKELKLRERVKRALIVVPPALQLKWERELRERFNEHFRIYTSDLLKTLSIGGGNPWLAFDQVIVSMDLAKMTPYKDWLEDAEWDLVIIDEAHKLAAHKYGNRVYYTDRFKLGELLHLRTRCLLLLTATPHSGESFAFYKLISLVDPYLFPTEYHLEREKLKRVMIRRLKEDVRELFPSRESMTISVKFSNEERAVYEKLVKYVTYYFNIAKEARNRGVGFAMTILLKRMGSSIYALRKSLENRICRLEEILKNGKFFELTNEDWNIIKMYEESPEDVEEEILEDVRRKIEAMTMASKPEELRLEIQQLRDILTLLDNVTVDTKAQHLMEFLKKLHEKAPYEKILIFTEYRDTMEYLKRLLEEGGYEKVAYIHGSMGMEEREEQMRIFRGYDDVKVMVATDAAAEGIDLQYGCHVMVNYELPWNPNRIEQRVGRLHRYGQNKKVLIYNLFEDTLEAKVLQRLHEKLETIKREMGERVFDVIGRLLSGVKIDRLIMDIITAGEEKFESKIRDALRKIDENREIIELLEKKSLIRDLIDQSFVLKIQESLLETAVGELDVERFIKRFISFYKGALEEIGDRVYRVKLTDELRDITWLKDGDCITFFRGVAEATRAKLITLGTSIMDRILHVASDLSFGGWTTIKVDPRGRKGFLFLYRLSVANAKGDLTWKKLLTLFYDLDSRKMYQVDPKIVWDLKNPKLDDVNVPDEVLGSLDDCLEELDESLMSLKKAFEEELNQKLKRELDIRLRDMEEFYEYKIKEHHRRIREYKMRLPIEDMRISIRREEDEIRKCEANRERERRDLELKYTLIEGEYPELIAAAVILPEASESSSTIDTREVERLSIEEVMKYEISQGRKPTDVSKEFRGYDVLSEGADGRRFIEVKAFAESGDVEMTSNEWITAERLGDNYWLYIVENVLDDKRRRIITIQNPYKTFKENSEIKEVKDFRVIIKRDCWKIFVRNKPEKRIYA